MKRFLAVLISMFLALSFANSLDAQQLSFIGVPVSAPCVWPVTTTASFANMLVSLMTDLKSIASSAAVLNAKHVTLTSGAAPQPLPDPPIDTTQTSVVIGAVQATNDVTLTAGDACTNALFVTLSAMAALNDLNVDAILTKYKVQIVSATDAKLFPRP